jgi:hypothetical protein
VIEMGLVEVLVQNRFMSRAERLTLPWMNVQSRGRTFDGRAISLI